MIIIAANWLFFFAFVLFLKFCCYGYCHLKCAAATSLTVNAFASPITTVLLMLLLLLLAINIEAAIVAIANTIIVIAIIASHQLIVAAFYYIF